MNFGHRVKLDDIKVIAPGQKYHLRIIRKALVIAKNLPNLTGIRLQTISNLKIVSSIISEHDYSPKSFWNADVRNFTYTARYLLESLTPHFILLLITEIIENMNMTDRRFRIDEVPYKISY